MFLVGKTKLLQNYDQTFAILYEIKNLSKYIRSYKDTEYSIIRIQRLHLPRQILIEKIFKVLLLFPNTKGGEKTDGAVLGSCEQYHTETDAWSKIGALPSPRRGHACLVDGCRILHVSGGLYGRYGRKNLW